VSSRLHARTCLVLGLVCLQTADLLCTYLLLDGGGRADVYEANPLARSVLATGGWAGVAAFKFSITFVAVLASLMVSRRRPATAVRLLATLCAVMLGVNAYSGSLLASPDPNAVAERQANERAEYLTGQVDGTREFLNARTAICDAVLDGQCDTAEAASRLTDLVGSYGPRLRLPSVARLPDPSRPGEALAYLSYHLRDRAAQRGMTDRLAGIVAPEPPKAAVSDPFTPPWLRPAAH
jgi:Domain of unknown function (DUF5658)